MAFCSNCGNVMDENDKFCSVCGCAVKSKGKKANGENAVQPSSETGSQSTYTERKQEFAGKIVKCPVCGAEIPSFTAVCPSCGHEINSQTVSVAVKRFIDAINKCDTAIANDSEPQQTGWKIWSKGFKIAWVILNLVTLCIPLVVYLVFPLIKPLLFPNEIPALSVEEKRKVALIENSTFPNEREATVETMMFLKSKIAFLASEKFDRKTLYWANIWYTKAEQLNHRANIILKDDEVVKNVYADVIMSKESIKKKQKLRAGIGFIIVGLYLILVSVSVAVVFGGGKHYEVSRQMGEVSTVSNIVSNTNTKDDFNWRTDGLFAYLPKPEVNYSRIIFETQDSLQIEFDNISQDQFDSYVNICKQSGFSEDAMQVDNFFWGYSAEGLDLSISYFADDKMMEIMINSYSINGEGMNSETTNSVEKDISDEFVAGYEKADFSSYNTPAVGNRLEGKPIYIIGALVETEILEADGTKTILGYVVDDNGNTWLLLMHTIPVVAEEYFDAALGKEIICTAVYEGYSEVKEMPAATLSELMIIENGTVIDGMQKLFDD